MVGLLRYKTAHKCSLSAPFRHSGADRNPSVMGPVRSYNRAFTYPCQLTGGLGIDSTGIELMPVGNLLASSIAVASNGLQRNDSLETAKLLTEALSTQLYGEWLSECSSDHWHH